MNYLIFLFFTQRSSRHYASATNVGQDMRIFIHGGWSTVIGAVAQGVPCGHSKATIVHPQSMNYGVQMVARLWTFTVSYLHHCQNLHHSILHQLRNSGPTSFEQMQVRILWCQVGADHPVISITTKL